MSVVIAGHVTHDRYGEDLVAGGCAFYGAHVHAGLGAHVRLVAGVGEDFACDHALTGIERRVRRAGQTTRFTNRYPAGGAARSRSMRRRRRSRRTSCPRRGRAPICCTWRR